MRLTITLNGEQVKNALMHYIVDNEKFDINEYEVSPEFVLTLDSSDKFDTANDDSISIDLDKAGSKYNMLVAERNRLANDENEPDPED